MKKILFLFLLGCFILPAQAKNFQADIARAAFRTRTAQGAALHPAPSKNLRPDGEPVPSRQEQMKASLAKEVSRATPHKSWDYFLAESQKIQQPAKNDINGTWRVLTHLYDTDCRLFSKILGDTVWGRGRPDYAEETKNFKYIYVTDASDHHTKTIPAEVIHVMQSIRQANPRARILLAMEFAVQKDKDKLPLRLANDKELPFFVYGEYQPLVEAADRLDTDILGLDDLLLSAQGIKVGDVIIDTPLQDVAIQKIISQYGPEAVQILEMLEEIPIFKDSLRELWDELTAWLEAYQKNPQQTAQYAGRTPRELYTLLLKRQKELSEKEQANREYEEEVSKALLSYLRDFLARSDWGVLQRNRQWARYIKALSPFYDIIITYAGSAHIESGMQTLPDLIKEEYISFDFYTREELAEKDKNFFKNAEQIQRQEGSRVNLFRNIEWREDIVTELRQSVGDISDFPEDLSTAPIIFSKNSQALLSAQEEDEMDALCERLDIFSDSKDVSPAARFEVFLPDIRESR